jgi:hypothetical protein
MFDVRVDYLGCKLRAGFLAFSGRLGEAREPAAALLRVEQVLDQAGGNEAGTDGLDRQPIGRLLRGEPFDHPRPSGLAGGLSAGVGKLGLVFRADQSNDRRGRRAPQPGSGGPVRLVKAERRGLGIPPLGCLIEKLGRADRPERTGGVHQHVDLARLT